MMFLRRLKCVFAIPPFRTGPWRYPVVIIDSYPKSRVSGPNCRPASQGISAECPEAWIGRLGGPRCL